MGRKLKREIYTKAIILNITPIQWAKLKHVCAHNNRTVNDQLRMLIDYSIKVYESAVGEIKVHSEPGETASPKQ